MPSIKPSFSTHSIVFTILFVACIPKHPVESLERQARQYDRQAERMQAEVFEDDRYFIPIDDVASSIATDLMQIDTIGEFSHERVGTDWSYEGTIRIDTSGEFFDQSRTRRSVLISQIGPEVEVSESMISGRRRINADMRATAWVDTSQPVETTSIRTSLAELEVEHLTTIQAKAKTETVLADFEASLPSDFKIINRTNTGLIVERVVSTHKENHRKELWANWEARTTLIVHVDAETHLISVIEKNDHRFSTEANEGEWQAADNTGQTEAIDWLTSALRIGMPMGHERFGQTRLTAPVANVSLSNPPHPPKLRNINEIAIAVQTRAFQTSTGNFTVCLDHILINPTSASGYDWDLPGMSNILSATSEATGDAGVIMGELNSIADQQPVIGMLMDAGAAYITGETLNRKQIESITSATSTITGWTNAHLPVKPDIAGTIIIHNSAFNLSQTDDSLRIDTHICAVGSYYHGGQAIQATLWDIDLSYNDAVGTCTIPLETIINQGVTGVPCGWARLYLSASYNFSYDQISVVGLPPAE